MNKHKHGNKHKIWRTDLLLVLLFGIFFVINVPLTVFAKTRDTRPRIALIPFENLSGQFGAGEEVMAGLTEVLQRDFFLIRTGIL